MLYDNVWLCVSVTLEKLIKYFYLFHFFFIRKYVQFWKLAFCDAIKNNPCNTKDRQVFIPLSC